MRQTFIVSLEDKKEQRLDVYLTELLEDWTRSQIKRQIDMQKALVNGKPCKAGYLVKNGDEISVDFSQEVGLEDVLPENIPLNIVFEDENYAVINKPQGMVVHPAPGNYTHTLVNALLYHFTSLSNGDKFRPGIVHRIDKDTSGLLVVAKNDKAHLNLANQIAEHSCRRTYVALLEGNVKEDSGTISTYLNRDKWDRKKYAVSGTGKWAVTHFKVLERYEGYTLCQFELETGRTHQIRVHASFMGHPIVGDPVYGYKKQKFNLNGQLLHAKKLSFVSPTDNRPCEFECEIPDYFANLLKKLKKK
ncbi:MAG: RluA family pseudouridine synthase [Clostridia bacterium]|nr:RluA family pseudouridine synthase [Clostridia bacterium]